MNVSNKYRQCNILVKYCNIGKVIDEINANYGTVLNMSLHKKTYKLNVKLNGDDIPKQIAVYTQDRENHWYIDDVTIRSS
tara:strand:- start:1979 stop:2218 length:240 start_codon:yes stop_codon:yes gene_type:complete